MENGKGGNSPMEEKRAEQPVLPPCRVCTSKASGIHFGLISCEACKEFYRRTLLAGKQYRCKKQGACTVDTPETRSKCSHCRLKRCYALGMSRQGIQRGRYNYEVKMNTVNEVKRLQQDKQDLQLKLIKQQEEREGKLQKLVDDVVRADLTHPLFPPDTTCALRNKMYSKLDYINGQEQLIGSMRLLPKHLYEELYRNTGLDVDDRRRKMQNCMQKCEVEIITYFNYLSCLPGFKDLSEKDQLQLALGSAIEWYILSLYKLHDLTNQACICPSCEEIFTVEDFVAYLDLSYEANVRATRKLVDFNMTQDEISLLKALCAFKTWIPWNLEPLSDVAKIEEHQGALLEALMYVLCKNRGPDKVALTLGRIADILTDMSEASTRFDSARGTSWISAYPDVPVPSLVRDFMVLKV